MEELMQMIQKVHPEVKEIILVSDNAGQFCAGENINYILSRNKVNWGKYFKVTDYSSAREDKLHQYQVKKICKRKKSKSGIPS